MDKVLEVLGKLKYPTLFVLVGAAFFIVAGVQSLSISGAQLMPYNVIARGGMALVGAVFVGIGLFLILRDGRQGAPTIKRETEYDVFLAAPMAGTETEEEYAAFRQLCLEVLADLRSFSGVKTAYFVGEKLPSRSSFESFEVAAELDFEAIRKSSNFVMIYPRRMVSSVLCEAGFALAEGVPSIYFVRTEGDLPYLLTKAGELPEGDFPPVHVHSYDTTDSLRQIIRNNGARLLSAAAAA